MTVVERKGNNDVRGVIRLSAIFAMAACGAAVDGRTSAPKSLTCRSDGSTNRLSLAYLPLPSGFKSLTGTMSRPRKGNGNYLLRVVLVDAHDPPNHATGLISQPFPPLPKPAPLFGYGFSLKESADFGKQTHEAPNRWLVVADEFNLRIALTPKSQVAARLTWELDGKSRDYEYSVRSVRSDYRRLAIACWNGDFALSNIRFESR